MNGRRTRGNVQGPESLKLGNENYQALSDYQGLRRFPSKCEIKSISCGGQVSTLVHFGWLQTAVDCLSQPSTICKLTRPLYANLLQT